VRPSSPRAIEDQTALHFVAVSEPVVPEAGREAWWDSQECFAAYMRSEDHHSEYRKASTAPASASSDATKSSPDDYRPRQRRGRSVPPTGRPR
jgi:hypothetical protein